MHQTKQKAVKVLCLAAALLYSSWPLGYLLNPEVAHASLASGLEAVNQPYNWVFVLADVASSLFVIIACVLLWKAYKHSHTRRIIALGLSCTAYFAIGTIVDALLPEHCVPNLMVCPNFTQDHYLLFHGVFSILASLFLFFALFVSWLSERKNIVLIALLAGYVVFGALSLVQALAPSTKGNWSQDYYITLCSIWLLLLPYTVAFMARSRTEAI